MDICEISGLPKYVSNEEVLIRFVFSSSHIKNGKVRGDAFMPWPLKMETSVTRGPGLDCEIDWNAGRKIGEARGLNLRGAGVVIVRVVRKAHLDAVAQEPPPKHANIVGWTTGGADTAQNKSAWMKQALEIAAEAALKLVPTTP